MAIAIKHAINGGLAECDGEDLVKILESGQWIDVSGEGRAAPTTRKAATKLAATAAKTHAEASSQLEG